jgi:hypothetical protein
VVRTQIDGLRAADATAAGVGGITAIEVPTSLAHGSPDE